jgi:hypothetical protein
MVWVMAAALAYIADTYIPGFEGTRWWFVIVVIVLGSIELAYKAIATMMQDPKEDVKLPFWMILVFLVGMLINASILIFFAPTLILLIIPYMIISTSVFFYVISKTGV